MANTTAFISDLRTALQSPEMQRLFADILYKCRILESSFIAQDAQSTAFYEGQRSVGIWLKQQIDTTDPQAFTRLMALERRKKHG